MFVFYVIIIILTPSYIMVGTNVGVYACVIRSASNCNNVPNSLVMQVSMSLDRPTDSAHLKEGRRLKRLQSSISLSLYCNLFSLNLRKKKLIFVFLMKLHKFNEKKITNLMNI